MSNMNRSDDNKTSMKLSHEDISESDRIVTVPLTVSAAAKMWIKDESTKNGRIENNNKKWKPFTVEELRMQAEDPSFVKKKRVLGIKKRYEVFPSIHPITLDEIRYRTTHPKKLNHLARASVAGPPNGFSKKFELSKQDAMIKAQGMDLKTKKYQLLHSDLGKLLRSTSPDGSPTNTATTGNGNPNNSPSRPVTLSA